MAAAIVGMPRLGSSTKTLATKTITCSKKENDKGGRNGQ